MKKKIKILILTAAAFVVLLGVNAAIDKEKVYINEVRSTTVSANRDGYFGSDYIELYNGSTETVSLDGWYLSDDGRNLKKSRINGVVIQAKSYGAVYADGVGEEENTVNFKISSKGEKLFLSDPEGNLRDSVQVPELRYGQSYARVTDGAEQWKIMEETFLSANSEGKIIPPCVLKKPVFSHESGFYDERFILKIGCNPGETIHYTLDGSIPTKESKVYENGILIEDISDQPNVCTAVRNLVDDWAEKEPPAERVDKARVVRAVAMDKKGRVSEVVTKTYFVNLKEYETQNILSVVGEYDEFFGPDGIFVTGRSYDEWYTSGKEGDQPPELFTQSGREWEVPGNIEVFQNGQEIANQQTGIRTHGGSSRHARFKRMSFFAREIYSGSDYLEGFFMNGQKIHSMGTDENLTSILLQNLLKNRKVSIQDHVQAAVFLNGEFWSEGCVLGRYDKYYFANHYGVNPENVIVVRDGEISVGEKSDLITYFDILGRALNKDLSQQEEYQKLKDRMDIQSYIEFLCANIYLCNMDLSETKNYCLWRVREPEQSEEGDGRWRWMLYDMDSLEAVSLKYYGAESAAQIDSFCQKMEFTGSAMNEMSLFKGLKQNQEFCKQFVLTFQDMVNVDFEYERILSIFEEFGEKTERFGEFFEKRAEYILPYMAKEFALTGTPEEVNLKVNDEKGGRIILNTTTPDLSKGSWTGQYYTDYPITVTAEPEKGYKFIGWSGSVTSDHATIEAEVVPRGITLEAVFEKMAE